MYTRQKLMSQLLANPVYVLQEMARPELSQKRILLLLKVVLLAVWLILCTWCVKHLTGIAQSDAAPTTQSGHHEAYLTCHEHTCIHAA